MCSTHGITKCSVILTALGLQVNTATGAASCSFTCTPQGVQQLVTHTGTYDRWGEAVIENSYGRLSLVPDPLVLPTLYMPQGAAAGQNAFAYSEAPVSGHMQAQGYDMSSDFHTVLVRLLLLRGSAWVTLYVYRHLCCAMLSSDITMLLVRPAVICSLRCKSNRLPVG
jgi:hypothetical protein